MFRLNRNKQKTNRNCLIGSIFCYFYRKIGFFQFFVFFRFFGFFRCVLKQFVSVSVWVYNRVFDLIWSYMFEYGPIWSSMWSYMWSFLCCSEVQLFRVPEVPSFPGFPRFPSFQSSVGSMLSKCWSVGICLFLRLCLSGREGSCWSTL